MFRSRLFPARSCLAGWWLDAKSTFNEHQIHKKQQTPVTSHNNMLAIQNRTQSRTDTSSLVQNGSL